MRARGRARTRAQLAAHALKPCACGAPQARTLLATFMNTVLLGYWLQFALQHSLRFWFIYLTNWRVSFARSAARTSHVAPFSLTHASAQDADGAVRVPHARRVRHVARGAAEHARRRCAQASARKRVLRLSPARPNDAVPSCILLRSYMPTLFYLQGIALPGSALVTLLFWRVQSARHIASLVSRLLTHGLAQAAGVPLLA
jgi:hypothetical protein